MPLCIKDSNQLWTIPDWLDTTFVAVLLVLLFAVCTSSAYDRYLQTSYQSALHGMEHYKNSPKALREFFHVKFCHQLISSPIDALMLPDQRIKVSFSITRNWYLLSAPVSQDTVDLKAISAIRIWSMVLIIYGHSQVLGFVMPRQDSLAADTVRLHM